MRGVLCFNILSWHTKTISESVLTSAQDKSSLLCPAAGPSLWYPTSNPGKRPESSTIYRSVDFPQSGSVKQNYATASFLSLHYVELAFELRGGVRNGTTSG